MIRGGNGTLSELSAAYMNKKPVVVIETTGGWAAKLKEVAFEGSYLDERRTVEIHFSKSAKEAVELALKMVKEEMNPIRNTGLIGR